MIKKIAILTSGGDAPGMNASIRATVRTAIRYGIKVAFIYNGYEGIFTNNIKNNIKKHDVGDIINRGGSILGCSRFPELKNEKVQEKVANILKKNNIDALVVIGGDGSFKGAHKLQKFGIHFIGIPGTIDNDIVGTDETIGFDTCLNTIIQSIDKIRDTSSSHHRCIIIETMGRMCGDLSIYSGFASGADIIIPPGEKINFNEICSIISERKKDKKSHTIITITEHITDIFELASEIEKRTKVETRATSLGFIQRGGRPSFRDRFLGTIFGYKAVMILRNQIYNVFIGIKGNEIKYYHIDDIDNLTNNSSLHFVTISRIMD